MPVTLNTLFKLAVYITRNIVRFIKFTKTFIHFSYYRERQ